MKLYLGIIKNEKSDVINHRSLLKIILNPLLNIFGYIIASEFDFETKNFIKYKIIRCKKVLCLKRLKDAWIYTFDKNKSSIVKQRRIW